MKNLQSVTAKKYFILFFLYTFEERETKIKI